MSATPTLTDFLGARFDEDEAAARDTRWLALEYGVDSYGQEMFAARVLATCAALRQIVAEHKMMEPRFNIVWRDGCCETCTAWGEYGGPNEDGTPNYCPTLRALAAIWSGHPEFREEWKP